MRARTPLGEVVLDAVAVYRLTRLLQRDEIPPLPAARDKLMQRYGASPWSQLLDCPWCLGIWVAALAVLARRVSPRMWRVLARVLASSAVTGVISEWLVSIEPVEDTAVVKHYRYEPAPTVHRGRTGEEEAARMRARLPQE